MKIVKSIPWVKVCFLSILFLTIFLRFYNYNNRWGLAYDQAHDVLVAREALREHKLPLLGPFSSAGPFQTGGAWYWLIMLGVLINPSSIVAPWILLTSLSVFFVIMLIYVGKQIGGVQLGLISGLLGAVSTAQNTQSTNLTNQSPLSLLALLSIWASVSYLIHKKRSAIMLMSFFISLAISIHLQGVALLPLLALVVVMTRFRNFLFVVLGFLLPQLSLIYYDLQHNFFNFNNMFTYYFNNSNPVSYEMLGRRWLTYMSIFWPKEWSHITGGLLSIGIIALVVSVFMIGRSMVKKQLPKEIVSLTLAAVISVILLRYVRTPLYSSYLTFLHPFILLMVGWSLWKVIQKNIYLGLSLLLIISAGSFVTTWHDLTTSTNTTITLVNNWKERLDTMVQAPSYRIYDQNYQNVGLSVPLSLVLDVAGKSSADGLNLGVGYGKIFGAPEAGIAIGKSTGLQIFDLSASTSSELNQGKWIPVDAKSIYLATEEWMQ